MANELRVRANFAAGALDAALTNSGTSMSSPALADLPAIGTTEYAAISLVTANSDGRITAKEIVYVTAHTASATTATILRGQEGTTGVAWAIGDKWKHAPVAADFRLQQTVRKTADESVTSSATLQDDDALLIQIGANETWWAEWVLFATGAQAGDIATAIVAPAGATGWWAGYGLLPSVTEASGAGDIRTGADPFGTSHNFGIISTTMPVLIRLVAMCVNGGTAGSLKLQWAQGASSATATVVGAHSVLRAERL